MDLRDVVEPTRLRRALAYFSAPRRDERRLERAYSDYGPHLRPCTRVLGGTQFEPTDPPVGIRREAIYVPRGRGGAHLDTAWGLYDRDGASIDDASYRRGPGRVRVGQSAATSLRPGGIARAPEGAYVYGGTLHRHYGHFLLSGLAWLWPRLGRCPRDTRIVYHGDDDPDALFGYPFIAACLGALDIRPENLVRFPEPTTLPEIRVPAPSYVETCRAHAIHARLGAQIGTRLLGPAPRETEARPVFLARDRLPTGVRRVVDEPAIVDRLERAGVRIVRPEAMPLHEQVAVFDAHPLVIGSLGSALHTSLLAPARQGVGPARLLALHHERSMPSDFALIDRLKGHRCDYVYPSGQTIPVDLALTGFQLEFRIDNLDATLDALLRLIDTRMAQASRLR